MFDTSVIDTQKETYKENTQYVDEIQSQNRILPFSPKQQQQQDDVYTHRMQVVDDQDVDDKFQKDSVIEWNHDTEIMNRRRESTSYSNALTQAYGNLNSPYRNSVDMSPMGNAFNYSNEHLFNVKKKQIPAGKLDPIRKKSAGLPINLNDYDKYKNHIHLNRSDKSNIKERNRLNDHSIDLKTLQHIYKFDCERGLSNHQVVENRTLKTKNMNQLVKIKQTGSKWKEIKDLLFEYKLSILFAAIIFFVSYHNYIEDPSQILLGLILISILIIERKKLLDNNYYQQKTMEAIKDLIPEKCIVVRDGKEQEIFTTNVVLGDIIILKPNIVVPVDCRIIKINQTEEIKVIRSDQSLLFQGKIPTTLNKTCNYPSHFLKSSNMALQGSIISQGSGKAVAVMTQIESYCCKTIIQSFTQIQNGRKQQFPIQSEICYFVSVFSYVSIFFASIFLLISYFQYQASLMTSFIIAGSSLVAFIPYGLITQIQCAKFMRDSSKSRLNYSTLNDYLLNFIFNFKQSIKKCSSFICNYFKYISKNQSKHQQFSNKCQDCNKYENIQSGGQKEKNNFISSLQQQQNSEKSFHINEYSHSIENIGQISCICSDIQQLIDYSKSEVNGLWVNGIEMNSLNQIIEVEENNFIDKTYQNFILASILANESSFSTSPSKIDLQTSYEAEGSYIDTAIIKFCENICDVNLTRFKHPIVTCQNGKNLMIPYDQKTQLTIVVVEEKSENYDYVLYVKGSPEIIWKLCENVEINGNLKPISEDLINQFSSAYKNFRQQGETVVALAKLPLKESNFKFGITNEFFDSQNKLNIQITNLTMLGLISVKQTFQNDIEKNLKLAKISGTKIIVHSNYDARTTLALAIQCGLIPDKDFQQGELIVDKYDDKSEQEKLNFHQNNSKQQQNNAKYSEQSKNGIDKASSQWNIDSQKATYIVISGNRLEEYIDTKDKTYDEIILKWLSKESCIFSNINHHQKQKIIPYLRKLKQTIAVTSNELDDLHYINTADISIAGTDSCNLLKRLSDIYLIRQKSQPDIELILNAIEEGRSFQENSKKIFAFNGSTKIAQIIPIIAYIILRIPLSVSAIFMILLSFITNFIPAVSLARENPDIDTLVNQSQQRIIKQKTKKVVTFRLFFYSYFYLGIISCAAGFCAFFTTMNHLGFPIKSIFGLFNQKGYIADNHMAFQMGYDDEVVSSYLQSIGPHVDIPANTVIETHMPHWNSLFMMPDGDCEEDLHHYNPSHKIIDWNDSLTSKVDLRKFYVYCDKDDKKWKTSINWSYCDSENYLNYSSFSENSACYTSEAINYGQTAYLLGVIFFQFSYLFAIKSLRSSFAQTSFNGLLVFSIITQLILCVFIVEVPGIQLIFRTRPLHFYQWGLPAIPFSVFILLHEEMRKYLTRNYMWFKKIGTL